MTATDALPPGTYQRSFPTPGRSAEAVRRNMLSLPPAGHTLALRWWRVGMATYLILGLAFVTALINAGHAGGGVHTLAALIGLGETPNVAILILVLSGIALTLFAAWRVRLDILAMKKEELDIKWVHDHGRDGLLLVFVEPAKREKMLGQPFDIAESDIVVETLMDDRVRRIRNAFVNPEAVAVSPEDLRGIAEVRTVQFGNFARYASSLLLLLAVLGTFAGVKTALPGLIESITASTNPGAQATGVASAGSDAGTNAGLIKSLNAVAEAFGGNALALIGAIAVGLMAQGVGFGRRNLLERLELVSSEFVYGQVASADANPMHAAIVSLRDTAREMHSASGAMLGIEDQLQALGREFHASFAALADRMHDIASGQEEGLYRKTSESLELLQRRVNELVDTVDGNARTYAGLTEAVKNRSQEASKSFDTMAESNRQLALALEGIIKTGERSRVSMEEVKGAVDTLKDATSQVVMQLTNLVTATQSIEPGMKQLGVTMESVDRRVTESERKAQDGWKGLTVEIIKKFDEAATRLPNREFREPREALVVQSAAVSMTGDGGRIEQLLETIASRIGQLSAPKPEPALWRTAVGPLVGVLIGVAMMFTLMRYVHL